MHQLGKFIQTLMDAEGMTRTDLERKSGLSRQHISKLLTNESLTRLPHRSTFDALAKAFPAHGDLPFIARAAEAIGVPVDRLAMVEPDYSKLSNEALLGILADRLSGGGQSDARSAEAEKSPGGGAGLRAVPDPDPADELARRRAWEAIPDDAAAYDTGEPSEYEKQVEQQDRAAERPDESGEE